ncbi:hypothetical protein [Myroides odoratimimus]|uniref:hypothetical protein n=1 Tax=Myroides odoratimimus TaxID=76832 RepID=UPI00257611D5|nr:hypothetical protein [Myroides odoratimimus]MDM1514519.1 hypothetical protein [Myroides odoratimimus]MDM1536381.1 hypothetical protein [Myroides odoratimimus]MDM1676045.1 hypothetical protein [Myroides odoratimimus]
MKQPTHYYIEVLGCPGYLASDNWINFIKSLDKQLVIASGVDNIISVISQSFKKNCAPDEKEYLRITEDEFDNEYNITVSNFPVAKIKEAFLCTSTTKN